MDNKMLELVFDESLSLETKGFMVYFKAVLNQVMSMNDIVQDEKILFDIAVEKIYQSIDREVIFRVAEDMQKNGYDLGI